MQYTNFKSQDSDLSAAFAAAAAAANATNTAIYSGLYNSQTPNPNPNYHNHHTQFQFQFPNVAGFNNPELNLSQALTSYHQSDPLPYPYYQTGLSIAPSGTQQFVPGTLSSSLWTKPTIQPQRIWNKVPKKAKVAQSAWCEVCKICCNAKDVLDKHKLGKKHLKNLEKLQQASAPASAASAGSSNTIIGPSENPAGSNGLQKSKEKGPNTLEDLQAKKRKVLEGGAAATAVRTCGVCNVVCNSDTVFRFHLAGQKHIAMMKRYATGT